MNFVKASELKKRQDWGFYICLCKQGKRLKFVHAAGMVRMLSEKRHENSR